MLNNIRLYERYLRVFWGLALIGYGITEPGWWASVVGITGIVLFYTGESGYCALYHMLGINKKFASANYFLSELPKYNDEPVLVFSRSGEILFQNASSKKKVPSVTSLDDILKENTAVVFEHDAAELPDLKLTTPTRIYRFHAKRDMKNDLLYLYGADVTDLEEKKERLKHEIITDALTGIGNRHKLLSDMPFHNGVISIDIARFGEVNSFFGHQNADRYLIAFAALLSDFVKQHKFVMEAYRIGGDIFAVGAGCSEQEKGEFRERLEQFAEEMVRYFDAVELQVESVDVSIDIVAGIAYRDRSGKNTFKDSQTALLEAKKRRAKFMVYDDLGEIEKLYEENIYWSKRLKTIFQGSESIRIEPYFQPVYHIAENRIEKFEALARVIEGETVTAPFKFIDSAKKTKLIPQLTAAMVNKSLARFQAETYAVSINVTMEDLEDKKLTATLEDAVKAYGVQPSKIVIEVLEDEEMYEYTEYLKELRQAGYQIAIDDFGIGYSNFAKLQSIGADYIKIDGSLIKNVDRGGSDAALVKSIVDYARSIGAKTIAEFVHSAEVFEAVKALGVDYAQGYYIGAPSPRIEAGFVHG